MARNRLFVAAPPESVWAVLADPDCYPRWVVGAKHIRSVEGSWPDPGSKFHHAVGVGPLEVRDNTEAVLADAPTHIVLDARARPLGRARIDLSLEPAGGGTMVTMVEVPTSPAVVRALTPLLDPPTWARNRVSLRRLATLAESQA